MEDACLIAFCTCSSPAEATRIANALVEERVAACVNILPGVRSIYRWQGAVESAEEILLLMKTTAGAFPKLRDRIIELHSYETPEVIAISVSDGSKSYLSWLQTQVE